MALEVGSAFARLGARLDDDGFQRFERRLGRTREEAKRGVTTKLKADADTSGIDRYEKRVRAADQSHGDLVRGSTRLRAGLGSLFIGGAGGAVATAGFYGLEKAASAAFGAYKESERVGRQTNAVLKSTGEVAGVSAKHVGDLATAISKKTGIDDEAIQSGENLLLTFTNIRNEAGKGNDIFDQTTKIMADMSAALGQDTKSSAIQLGKALNDPVKGVTALQRVGVSFTKSQKDQIKTLEDSGHHLDAQRIILRELRGEFGGSAAATATSSAKLKVTLGNLAESVGKVLSPTFERIARRLNTFVTGMVDGTGKGGRFVAMARNAAGVIGGAFSAAVGVARRVLDGIKAVIADRSAQLEELGAIARRIGNRIIGAVRQIAGAFRQVFSGRDGIGGDLKNIGERLIDFMLIVAKVADAITKRSIPGIVQVFRGLATILKGVIRVISGLLSGDFDKAWDGVKTIFRGAVKAIGGIVRAATAPLRSAAAAIGRGIGGALDSAWNGILGKAERFINKLIDVVNAPLKVLGLKTIGHVDLLGGGGGGGSGAGGGSSRGSSGPSVAQRATGGRVDAPIVIMGEEAPLYPEWVIPVNPAYRDRAVGLWMQAGRDLGIPGFARGGRRARGGGNVLAFAEGGQLSFDAVKQLWRSQGGRDTAADTMAWIADAESARKPLNNYGGHIGRIPGGGDTIAAGLYMILGRPFPGDVYDAATNTRMAISKSSNGANLGPWVSSRATWGRHVGQTTPHGGGGILGAIGSAIGSLIPDIHWPGVPDLGPFTGIPRAALGRIKDYVVNKIKHFGGGGGAMGEPGGGGLGRFDGLPVANWIIPILNWARQHGWQGHITSGYRDPRQVVHSSMVAPQGQSNHNRTAYPGGAIDVGSPEDRADGSALASVIAKAPLIGGRRLVWGGPAIGDWGHFSATGRRRGGRIPFEAFLTGGHRRGRTRRPPKPKGPPSPRLTAKANRGIVRSVARGERGIGPFEDIIRNLERDYDLENRRADLDPNDFLVENEDGSVTIDLAAQRDRRGELNKLIGIRRAIEAKVRQYRNAVHAAIKVYNEAIRRLQAALRAAKGKARSKERAGYREKLNTYYARRKELRGVEVDLGYDLQDAGIDFDELVNERTALEGARATPAPPADTAVDTGGGADAGGADPVAADPAEPVTTVTAPPTAEDIAAGVTAALATFNAGRAELFSTFGGNFMRAGAQATALDQAAGGRYFGGGAGGIGAGGALAAGGAPQITQQITFTGPQPADPHTFTQAALHELKAAV